MAACGGSPLAQKPAPSGARSSPANASAIDVSSLTGRIVFSGGPGQSEDVYIVNAELMRRLPERAILMHPLPRLDEIDPLVDSDPRAAYFRQARNGLWVRMAVLDWTMER